MLYLWPILISIVFHFLMGFLWYSIIFRKYWKEHLGFTDTILDLKIMDYLFRIIIAIFSTLLIALLMEIFFAYNPLFGLFAGAVIAGLVFIIGSSEVLFREKKWKLWLIDSGYHAFSLFVICIIIGSWNTGTFV